MNVYAAGKLQNWSFTDPESVFTPIHVPENVKSVACTQNTILFCTDNGKLYYMGQGDYFNNNIQVMFPTKLNILDGNFVVDICAGNQGMFAMLTSKGDVYFWDNGNGYNNGSTTSLGIKAAELLFFKDQWFFFLDKNRLLCSTTMNNRDSQYVSDQYFPLGTEIRYLTSKYIYYRSQDNPSLQRMKHSARNSYPNNTEELEKHTKLSTIKDLKPLGGSYILLHSDNLIEFSHRNQSRSKIKAQDIFGSNNSSWACLPSSKQLECYLHSKNNPSTPAQLEINPLTEEIHSVSLTNQFAVVLVRSRSETISQHIDLFSMLAPHSKSDILFYGNVNLPSSASSRNANAVKAHRFMLEHRFQKLDDIIAENETKQLSKEKKKDKRIAQLFIELPLEIDPAYFQDVIHFLYGEEISIDNSNINTLLSAAHAFGIDSLGEYILQNTSDFTVPMLESISQLRADNPYRKEMLGKVHMLSRNNNHNYNDNENNHDNNNNKIHSHNPRQHDSFLFYSPSFTSSFSGHPKYLARQHMKALWRNGWNSDFTIASREEAIKFHVHKAFLGSLSAPLAGMLFNDRMSESITGKMTSEMPPRVLRAFLSMIYCSDLGVPDLSVSELRELLENAHMYALGPIQEVVVHILVKRAGVTDLAVLMPLVVNYRNVPVFQPLKEKVTHLMEHVSSEQLMEFMSIAS
eukprot:gb/GECH01003002.1/.p1 GENE.gb/GECH01003002.1/~~gb/GECH01003002.1/.p1  ORF type:complete len:687 (+),score=138.78 gb/GECH01003002.1/:1-2061(+)